MEFKIGAINKDLLHSGNKGQNWVKVNLSGCSISKKMSELQTNFYAEDGIKYQEGKMIIRMEMMKKVANPNSPLYIQS